MNDTYRPSTDQTRFAPPELTEQQEKVAKLIGERMTYEAIGEQLGMSPHTARAHAMAVAAKLPNPHNLPTQRLILAWIVARDYLRSA